MGINSRTKSKRGRAGKGRVCERKEAGEKREGKKGAQRKGQLNLCGDRRRCNRRFRQPLQLQSRWTVSAIYRSKLLAPSGEGLASARMQRREVLLRVSDQLLSAPTFKGDEKDSRRPTRDAVSFFFVSSFPNSMHVCSRRRVRPNPSSRSSDRNTVDVPTLRSGNERLAGGGRGSRLLMMS